jgi:hypothetical protein
MKNVCWVLVWTIGTDKHLAARAVLVEFVELVGLAIHKFVLTGKCTAIYVKFLRKLDLTVNHVVKTSYFVQNG